MENWEQLPLCEDYQTKDHGTKGNVLWIFKKMFSLLRYPNFFKKDAIFGHSE